MKKLTRNIITLTLAICCLIAPFTTMASAAEVQPRLNNTLSTATTMAIYSDGELNIAYNYTGFYNVTTKAVITTYIQKRTLGIFWFRVDIGTENNEWVDTIYKEDYAGVRTYQLSERGTYRVNVEYKIYGSGGAADVLEYQGTDTY